MFSRWGIIFFTLGDFYFHVGIFFSSRWSRQAAFPRVRPFPHNSRGQFGSGRSPGRGLWRHIGLQGPPGKRMKKAKTCQNNLQNVAKKFVVVCSRLLTVRDRLRTVSSIDWCSFSSGGHHHAEIWRPEVGLGFGLDILEKTVKKWKIGCWSLECPVCWSPSLSSSFSFLSFPFLFPFSFLLFPFPSFFSLSFPLGGHVAVRNCGRKFCVFLRCGAFFACIAYALGFGDRLEIAKSPAETH